MVEHLEIHRGERANASGNTMEGLDDLICNEFACHETSAMFSKIKGTTLQCVSVKYRSLIHVYAVDHDDPTRCVTFWVEFPPLIHLRGRPACVSLTEKPYQPPPSPFIRS